MTDNIDDPEAGHAVVELPHQVLPLVAPDSPGGASDWDDMQSGLEEIADEVADGTLVYVEGQGWMYAEDVDEDER